VIATNGEYYSQQGIYIGLYSAERAGGGQDFSAPRYVVNLVAAPFVAFLSGDAERIPTKLRFSRWLELGAERDTSLQTWVIPMDNV
jgi:hypothetical protein